MFTWVGAKGGISNDTETRRQSFEVLSGLLYGNQQRNAEFVSRAKLLGAYVISARLVDTDATGVLPERTHRAVRAVVNPANNGDLPKHAIHKAAT